MFELDDCGKEIYLGLPRYMDEYYCFDAKVHMVIKAPRGTMALFEFAQFNPSTQCEAIRAFMEQHREEISLQEGDGEID